MGSVDVLNRIGDGLCGRDLGLGIVQRIHDVGFDLGADQQRAALGQTDVLRRLAVDVEQLPFTVSDDHGDSNLEGVACAGNFDGIGVAVGDLPPFIMTLGTMTAVRGLALLISNGKPVIGMSEPYKAIAASSVAGIPMLAIFLVIVIIICSFVLAKTVYGRRVYACGGNLQAAKVAGINTTAIRISTFAIAGFLAGFCGFLMTSRVTIGQPTAAESYEMDAITACVVGGVSMTGGVGKPWGVVIGTLLITVIANGLDILGVSSHWQKIVKGLIIVLAVLIDVKGKSKKD